MADLIIASDEVVFVQGDTFSYEVGATVTPAVPVYYDESLDQYFPASCDTVSNTAAMVIGLTNGSGVAGRVVSIQTDGILDLGASAAVVVGTTYVLSTTGKICPIADQAANDWVCWIGVGNANNQLHLAIENFGIKKP